MSDPKYQRHTGAYHLGLSAACLLASAWLGWRGTLTEAAALGLVLTCITNALVSWEKYNLLRRGRA